MNIDINALREELNQLEKESLVGIDIETITVQETPDKWSIKPFEVGFYAPKSNKKLTLYINPYYWVNMTRVENALFFYPREKYRNGEGFVVAEETAIELLSGLKLKTVYGHNCLKFDFPHLHANGMTIKAKKIVDTFLESGAALPLKYYTTLLEWHEKKMQELKEAEEKAGELGLTKEEKKKYYKFFTEKGNLKMTAEAIYCFISGNPDFEEAHTALHDAIIEYEIYKYIAKRTAVGEVQGGNWMTNLFNFFSKFKRGQKMAEKIKQLMVKMGNDSYTDKLIMQYLWG